MASATAPDVIALLRNEVPRQLLEQMVRTVVAGHRSVANPELVLRNVTGRSSRDLAPHIRRCLIDSRLIATAGLHGAKARAERHKGGQHYALIESGRFIFTVHYVRSINTVVRRAKHRETLALVNQHDLFEQVPERPNAPIYAVLLHGTGGEQGRPGFVALRFPDHEFKSYYGAPYDLLAEFPSAITAAAFPMEEIADQAAVALKHVARQDTA